MSTPELGRTEQVTNIRDIWPHEALNFTPWLAENLELLGDALDMRLELVRREAAVGPYSLDILAKEVNNGVTVAIENQLEWTDFHHLAQVLIYSAGTNARIAIWVAPEFRYESAEVLNWLNKWTRDGLDFYGVRFDVGDSADETTFHKVVYPGGWNKGLTLPPEPPPPPHLKQHDDFFGPLIIKLREEDFADSVRQRFGYADRFFPSRLHRYTGYMASFYRNSAWASLHIETSDKDLTNRIFDELKEQQESIQSSFEAELDWDKRYKETFSYINLKRDGSIDDVEKLEEIRAWMLEQLQKLKEVLDPHLERVLNELQSEGAGDGGPAP